MKTIRTVLNMSLLATSLLAGGAAYGDSIHEWGQWSMSEEDAIRQAILEGVDPTAVTRAPAAGPATGGAGTALQPFIGETLDNRILTQEQLPKDLMPLLAAPPPPPEHPGGSDGGFGGVIRTD